MNGHHLFNIVNTVINVACLLLLPGRELNNRVNIDRKVNTGGER